METKSAKALTAYIDEAYKTFGKVYRREVEDKKELDRYKRKFSDEKFEEKYNDFKIELNENIVAFPNINQVQAYLAACFEKFRNWYPFNDDDDVSIIQRGYQTGFLIKLKENIESVNNLLYTLCVKGMDGEAGTVLMQVFNKTLNIKNGAKGQEELSYREPEYDNRFDFDLLISECNLLQNTTEKRKLITQRLFDFKQWQIKYDVEITEVFGDKYYHYTRAFYPKFQELCENELYRIERLNQIGGKEPIIAEQPENKIQEDFYSIYEWNADVNDMVELVTALHKAKAIKRIDDKKITMTELTQWFEKMFNKEVKNEKGSRAHISNKSLNRTLFTKELYDAFKKYRDEDAETGIPLDRPRNTGL
jgi:hypothetical protein